mmetsp:Transcript_16390/g.21451  ORF Transcript_16390/g.21451 Transcript_16390/m.21451 type:complete len:231 (-) Transcript_16390:200-892(-)|eukprot:CAMPEP_0198149182 /NCGR_PEP_ID=MMETSP1443-20131203/45309_1 /TAXON_ID=186043 /ORGANISM="Entomoneis sp., Strain CCMP2396" /LENGTH=230 /DNA_ID=CAMNT_0043814129 /DNA_START=54 /DNA_END=746 /DNA_ORIENTATION=-
MVYVYFVTSLALILLNYESTSVAAFADYAAYRQVRPQKTRFGNSKVQSISAHKDDAPSLLDQHTAASTHPNRRTVFKAAAASVPLLWWQMAHPTASHAAARSNIKPEVAFKNILAAREELVLAARTYMPTRDYNGLREFLDGEKGVNMRNYEANAQALLGSKLLDIESKKEIGTIRRYGVGADVIIMYGGLRTEIDEDNEYPNYQEVQKKLLLTLDSLGEVIAICRGNGL